MASQVAGHRRSSTVEGAPRWSTTIAWTVAMLGLLAIAHVPGALDPMSVSDPGGAATPGPGWTLALAVPAWWELVATRRTGHGVVSAPGWHWRRVAWYVVLVVAALLLHVGPIVTSPPLSTDATFTREAVLALLALSAYLDWSRRFVLTGGTATVRCRPAHQRAWWYVVGAVLLVAGSVAAARIPLVPELATLLRHHGGLPAIALAVPLLFDVVLPATGGDPVRAVPAARRRRAWPVFAWLVGAPGLAAIASIGGDSTVPAQARAAGLALAVVGLASWVEVARRRDGVPPARAGTTPRGRGRPDPRG